MPEPLALTFTTAPTDPRDRLDKLVVALLTRAGHPTTRATIQRWIDHGRVLVDGAPAKPSASLRTDVIRGFGEAASVPNRCLPWNRLPRLAKVKSNSRKVRSDGGSSTMSFDSSRSSAIRLAPTASFAVGRLERRLTT